MAEALLYLDRDSTLNLQAQIRQKLVEAIAVEASAKTRSAASGRMANPFVEFQSRDQWSRFTNTTAGGGSLADRDHWSRL